jgi:hypothetical protein
VVQVKLWQAPPAPRVVVGLTAALLIAVIGIAAQQFNLGTDIMTAEGPTVIKAGAPVVFTVRSGPVVR